MSTINHTFGAAGAAKFSGVGNFFRLLATSVGAVTIRFFKNGAQIGEDVDSIYAGYAEAFEEEFDAIEIETAVAQTVKLVTRSGSKVDYNISSGAVNVTNMPAVNGAFAHTAQTVTSASAQMLAANGFRRYLLIQNNDASGDIFVRLDGTAATATTGIKLGPGASYECQGFVPTGAVTAIGSIASNANVLTVEG